MSETLLALIVFAFVTTITPGPNNVMLTASGANFGFLRTLPHMLGITFGFPVMVIAVGLGAAQLLQDSPELHRAVKVMGAAYLLWLAWHIARAGRGDTTTTARAPMGFWGAAAFQWINPKAWMMLAGALPAFTSVGGDLIGEVLMIAIVFVLACLPSCAVWCAFGVGIGKMLGSDRALRNFNWAMAGLLVASVLAMLR